MQEKPLTTADLLTAWREASRAAELAERLAAVGLDAVEQADVQVASSEELAQLAADSAAAAKRANEKATAAATRATKAANEATEAAGQAREGLRQDAEAAAAGAQAAGEAKRQYREAEDNVRKRIGLDGEKP